MGKKRAKARTIAFVLDSSVTLAWFYQDEGERYARAVVNSLKTAAALVPSLWPLEVVNVLLVGERRGRNTEAESQAFVRLLRSFPITLDDETAQAWTAVPPLARAHGLSAYDAAYLDLALRRGLTLATLDERLKSAATAVGVPAYSP